jgi:hypothetical protein
VHLTRAWNLYGFDTLKRTVYVLDPTKGPLTDLSELRHKHGKTIGTLLDAFITCGSSSCAFGKLPSVHTGDTNFTVHTTIRGKRGRRPTSVGYVFCLNPVTSLIYLLFSPLNSTDTAIQVLHHAITFVPA